MTGANPKSKVSEFAERLNAIGDALTLGLPFNEMAWMKLLREIEEFGKLPEFAAISLLHQTVLWGFKNNSVKVNKLLNTYAGLFGKDIEWYLTRASKAPILGDIDVVKDLVNFDYPKGNIRVLGRVIESCNQSGLFVSANKALEQLRALGEEGARLARNEYYAHIPSACEYLNMHNVDEVEVGRRVVTASRVAIELSGALRQFNVQANRFGITFEFVIDAELDRLIDMDFAISESLADKFEDTLSNYISIGVSPWQEAG